MHKATGIILSIVIPTRNEINLLNLCSALSKQEYKELFQIIIVDESDPAYREIVTRCYKELQYSGIQVEVLFNTVRAGVGSSMIQGLLKAEGDYVFFLDADNIPSAFFTKKIIEKILSGRKTNAIPLVISFLSTAKYRESIWNRLLLVPRLYLSCFLGGLKYDKRFGFINVLKVWKRDVLLNYISVEILDPFISYLDDPIVKERTSSILINSTVCYIDEALVEDVRHLYEDFNLKFIYTRMKWYYNALLRLLRAKKISFRKKISLIIPILVYTSLLPISLFLTLNYVHVAVVALVMAYLIAFLILSQRRSIELMRKESMQAIVTLPLLLLLNSLVTYAILIHSAMKILRRI